MNDSILINGQRLFVNAQDQRGQRLLQTGSAFSPVAQSLWRHLLGLADWDLVVDVGANYGEMLLEIPLDSRAEVVAFEANPALLPYLRATLAQRAVTLEALAVCERTGTAQFHIDATWSGASSLATPRTAGSGNHIDLMHVPTTTLDQYFAHSQARRACIKIDVEGVEPFVLLGAQQWFARLDDYALLVEIRHATAEVLAALATHWRLFLWDVREGRFVRMHADGLLARGEGWHRDDAVLLPLGGRLAF